MLTNTIKLKIKTHALEDQTKECAGFVLLINGNTETLKCQNTSPLAEHHFVISHVEVKKALKLGKVLAIYHSHTSQKEKHDTDDLSDEDKFIAEYFKVNFIMYSLNTDKFYEYKPVGNWEVPYLERPFIPKLLDDIQLVTDYYRRELNLELTNTQNRNNKQLFLENNGFSIVSEVNKHNIILLNWANNKFDKYLGIYLGNEKVMVHLEHEYPKIISYNYGLKTWTKGIYAK